MKLYMKHDHYEESSLYGLASPDLLEVKGKKGKEKKYVTSNEVSMWCQKMSKQVNKRLDRDTNNFQMIKGTEIVQTQSNRNLIWSVEETI